MITDEHECQKVIATYCSLEMANEDNYFFFCYIQHWTDLYSFKSDFNELKNSVLSGESREG